MKLNIAALFPLLCSAGFDSSAAVASIIIPFDTSSPSPLVAGSFGTIDLLIKSDALALPDVLDAFQVDVTLTPIACRWHQVFINTAGCAVE